MQNLLRMGIAAAFLISCAVNAEGGISLGATRVIYPGEAKQTSLAVNNSDNKSRFLINSWVEDAQGQKVKTFAVTPPLFVSEPNSENTLRIIYVGPPLPTDRESLFWLNVKAIPSVEKENLVGKNVLHLAILSRIKLFVRPSTLTDPVHEAPAALNVTREGSSLKIANASPFYLSLVNVHINQQKLNNVMVAPKSSTQVALPSDARGDLTFQTVNDYGAVTAVRTVSLR